MSSFKKQTIINILTEKNKDYSQAIPKALEGYIRSKFKCSIYMARSITNELILKHNEQNTN